MTANGQTLKPDTSNVEKVELQVDAADTKAFNLDASLMNGVSEVWLKNMSAVSSTGDETVTVSNLAKTAAIGIKGGDKTTGIAAATGGDLAVTFAGAGSTDTQNVKLSDANIAKLTLATAETVAVDVTGASVITDLRDTAVKTLNVTGAGSVKLSAVTKAASTTSDTLATINASANTGGVTIGSATALDQAVTKTVTGGSGNDAFYVGNIFADATAAAKYDGGAGTDTLGVDTLTTLTTANAAIVNAVKNFETIEFTNTGVTAIQTNLLTGIHNFVFNNTGTNLAITGLETADTITIKADNTGADGDAAIDFSGAVAGQTLNLKLGGGIDLVGNATTGATTNNAIDLNTGISRVVINSTGKATDAANTITASVAATVAIDNGTVQSLEITGDKDLTISGGGASTSTATAKAAFSGAISIDASTFTGKLTLEGSKAATGDVVILGAGADTYNTAGGTDIITGGAGKDTFVISGAVAGDATAQIQITDFVSGTDTLKILEAGSGGPALGTATFTSTAVNVSTATTLAGALDLAATADGSTNAAVKWFNYGSDVYVVIDNSASTTALQATDAVIKLTGITTLAASDVSIA